MCWSLDHLYRHSVILHVRLVHFNITRERDAAAVGNGEQTAY